MKKFSFVKLLTDEDIVEILKRNNLRLLEDVKQPIIKGQDNDKEYTIVAKCEYIENPYSVEEEMHDLISTTLFKDIPFMQGLTKRYSLYDKTELVEIHDFYMEELMSLKSEEETKEHVLELTKNYHKFMTEKFGDMYTEKAEEFFNNLKEEENQQNKDAQK